MGWNTVQEFPLKEQNPGHTQCNAARHGDYGPIKTLSEKPRNPFARTGPAGQDSKISGEAPRLISVDTLTEAGRNGKTVRSLENGKALSFAKLSTVLTCSTASSAGTRDSDPNITVSLAYNSSHQRPETLMKSRVNSITCTNPTAPDTVNSASNNAPSNTELCTEKHRPISSRPVTPRLSSGAIRRSLTLKSSPRSTPVRTLEPTIHLSKEGPLEALAVPRKKSGEEQSSSLVKRMKKNTSQFRARKLILREYQKNLPGTAVCQVRYDIERTGETLCPRFYSIGGELIFQESRKDVVITRLGNFRIRCSEYGKEELLWELEAPTKRIAGHLFCVLKLYESQSTSMKSN